MNTQKILNSLKKCISHRFSCTVSSEIAFNDDVLKTNVPGYSKRDFAKLRRKQISLQPLFYPWFYQIKAVPKVFPHSHY